MASQRGPEWGHFAVSLLPYSRKQFFLWVLPPLGSRIGGGGLGAWCLLWVKPCDHSRPVRDAAVAAAFRVLGPGSASNELVATTTRAISEFPMTRLKYEERSWGTATVRTHSLGAKGDEHDAQNETSNPGDDGRPQLPAYALQHATVRRVWRDAAGIALADPGCGAVLRGVLSALWTADAVERNTYEAIEARNQMTPKIPRLSQLSASRQTLVRVCQDVNFGQIQGLHVRNSDPVWDPAPTVLSEVRLDIEEGPRPEGELPDFKLSSEIQRLMCQLDQLQDGKIEKIEVRGGVPRRLVLSSRLASRAVCRTLPRGDAV
jgi:hypothetical protein